MPKTLNLIGAGRVGQTLGRLWQQADVFYVQDVLTNSAGSAEAACAFMGGGAPVSAVSAMRPADVWMLAVPDAQIAAVAAQLAQQQVATNRKTEKAGTADIASSSVVFHCSGAQSSALLAPFTALGWHSASAHCILSFSSSQTALQQFPGTPCALEGDAHARALLLTAFEAIGAKCFEVKSEDKLLYHAAAVFATNFLPVLQAVAEDAWRASGVPTELLPGLRSALLTNAVNNITRLGPAGALTGPAARGDVAAIAKQADAVSAWDPAAGAAYEALSALALRMAKATTDKNATPASKY